MSDDRMTVEEIRRMYKEAKDQNAQIGILADINMCKPDIIQKIINGELDELPPLKVKGKVKSKYSRGKNNPVTEQEKEVIFSMYRAGNSATDIANALMRSITTIKSYIKKYREENEEVENVIFAEELTHEEREKLTKEAQSTAAAPVEEAQISEDDVGSIAGGILEMIAELYASGWVFSVQPANEKGIITVIVEKGDNYACLKRRVDQL